MKQTIVVRTDLGMGQGKLAAQVAHAALSAATEADDRTERSWRGSGQRKVVLAGSDEEAIHDVAERARIAGLPYAVIRDAGRTQLEPGTVTAVAVGPGEEDAVDRITGEFDLL